MSLQMQPVATELAQRFKPSDSTRLPSTYKYSRVILQPSKLRYNSTYYWMYNSDEIIFEDYAAAKINIVTVSFVDWL